MIVLRCIQCAEITSDPSLFRTRPNCKTFDVQTTFQEAFAKSVSIS